MYAISIPRKDEIPGSN